MSPFEQIEPLTKPFQQLFGAEHPDARGSQLDCKRQVVEATTHLVHGRRRRERCVERPGSRGEQRDAVLIP